MKKSCICKVCRKWQDHFYWSHRDSKNVRFFVKMEASSFRRYLNLPRKFAKNFRGEISGLVKLKGHSGKFWQVQVLRSDNTLALRSGWRDFVTANKIDENDFLVFKYSSNSSFDVLIFDPSGCEKAAPLIVKNELTESAESESETETDSESESESESETDKTSSDSDAPVRDITLPVKISSDSVLSSPATRAGEKRERNDEGTSRNAKKAQKTIFDERYYVPFKTELSDMQQKIADMMASATQQGSKSFVKILCSSDIKYHIVIPRCFGNAHLQKRNQPIRLQMANEDKTFPAQYCCAGDRQYIGSGWIEFATRNNLKANDLCLFEVKRLDAELAFVVHVPPGAN